MCGRYVLSLRPSVVRHRLAEQHMPTDDAPDDDDEQLRQSYNFAPGYHGLIYRAESNRERTQDNGKEQTESEDDRGRPAKRAKTTHVPADAQTAYRDDKDTAGLDGRMTRETRYKLQAAKWGLIPFWTKRAPDYGSQLKTINCRDDSLAQSGGMWNTMKQRKRCVVVAEGFYEWLKKDGGKEKMPHFVKRSDGQLMCFAGLWDSVRYEHTPEDQGPLYTYTIITTDSNKQLKFLHDRMPVILEPGSSEMKVWLDADRIGWDKDLQSMLKPFEGELEVYPVDKGVGKVGNNSPQFVVPVNSTENKNNIANFFGNQAAKSSPGKTKKKTTVVPEINGDSRETVVKNEGSEDNAPLPKPPDESVEQFEQVIKNENDQDGGEIPFKAESPREDGDTNPEEVKSNTTAASLGPTGARASSDSKSKLRELDDNAISEGEKIGTLGSGPSLTGTPPKKARAKKPKSATSNNAVKKIRSPVKSEGNAKITSFFGK